MRVGDVKLEKLDGDERVRAVADLDGVAGLAPANVLALLDALFEDDRNLRLDDH